MANIDEEELKKLFEEFKNNKNIFEKLYLKCNKLVYGIVFSILKNKEDSEDIVQIVFEKIYNLDVNKFPNIKASSWLYSLTKNEAISFLRKKDNTLDIDKIYEISDSNNDINEIISQDTYNRLISGLNDIEKQIISLKILGGFSFKEISKIIDMPIGTVKWKYYKSVNSIKIIIGNLGLFVITFVIGIKTLFSKNRSAEINQEIMINNENLDETLSVNEELENTRENNSIEQGIIEEELNSVYKSEDQNALLDTDILDNENIALVETQEGNREIPLNNVNYFGIGILCISLIFLGLSIIFIIKNQLKKKKKASK